MHQQPPPNAAPLSPPMRFPLTIPVQDSTNPRNSVNLKRWENELDRIADLVGNARGIPSPSPKHR